MDIKAHERLRVEWMIFYCAVAKENATLTARYFGISRKAFHKWLKRFEDSKYNVRTLLANLKPVGIRENEEVTLAQGDKTLKREISSL